MEYQTITLEIAEGVATVTLNRGEVMNALNGQMRAEITHAVTEAGQTARVVVLTGAGRAAHDLPNMGRGSPSGVAASPTVTASSSLASPALPKLLRQV